MKKILGLFGVLLLIFFHAQPAFSDAQEPSCMPQLIPIVASMSAGFDPKLFPGGKLTPRFLGMASCTDVYSSVVTAEMLKNSAPPGKNLAISSKPCPKDPVLLECVQPEPVGFMVIHYYKVAGKGDGLVKTYNHNRVAKGCEAPTWKKCQW